MRNSLSVLEPHSMDSLGHPNCTKKLSPKITHHFKVLCESKAMLPMYIFLKEILIYQKYPTILNLQDSFSPMGISICTPSLSIRSIELDSIQNIIEKYKQPFFIDEEKWSQFNFQSTCIMYTSGWGFGRTLSRYEACLLYKNSKGINCRHW